MCARGFMIPIRNPDGGTPITVFSLPPWMPRPECLGVCALRDYADNPVRWWEAGTWAPTPLPTVGMLFLDQWGQAEDDVKKPTAELLLNGRVRQLGFTQNLAGDLRL